MLWGSSLCLWFSAVSLWWTQWNLFICLILDTLIVCPLEPGGLQSMGLQRVRHDWATTSNTYMGAGFATSPCAQNIFNSQYLKFSVFYEALKIKAHPPTPILARPSRRGLFSVLCFHLWVLTSFKSGLSQSSSYCCQLSIAKKKKKNF